MPHTPKTARNLTPKINTRLYYALLQTLYYGAFCVSVTFLVPILQLYGWPDERIGLVMTCVAAGGALAGPLWGALCDRFRCTRAAVLALTAAPALFFAVMTPFGHIPGVLAVLFVLIGMTNQSAAGLIDSWASKLTGDGYSVSYGLSRGLGSLAYAVVSVLVGILFARLGVPMFLPAVLIFVPGLLLAVLKLPEPSVRKDRRHPTADLAALWAVRNFRRLLVCSFLAMFTFGSLITFYPVALTSLGGTSLHFGIAYGGMAAVELLTMSQYRRLRKRFSCGTLLAVSFAFTGVKNVLVGLSPNAPLAMLALLPQALAYALYIPAVVDYVAQTVDRRLLSTAQTTVYAAGMSLSQVFANVLCGYISGAIGPQPMLLLASIPAFAGAAVWVFTGKQSKGQAVPSLRL